MSDVPREPYEGMPEDQAGETFVEPDKDAKNWAMLAHLSGLLIYLLPGLGHIIGPLVIWLMKKDEHPFIDANGKEALNFQISVSIYLLIGALSLFACIGVIVIPAILVADAILSIIAAMKASNGELYRYPLTIRLVK
jgi:uncharacterized protein